MQGSCTWTSNIHEGIGRVKQTGMMLDMCAVRTGLCAGAVGALGVRPNIEKRAGNAEQMVLQSSAVVQEQCWWWIW